MNELAELKQYDLTKKQIEDFAANACREITSGKEDLLAVAKNLKALKMLVDMIEKYINGFVERERVEQKMLTQGLAEEYSKQLEIENYVAQKEK